MMKKFKKIKLVKGGGLELHFNDPIVSGSETYGRTLVVKSTVDIHPDLKTALDAMKPEFATVAGFTFIVNEMMSQPEFKATGDQSKYLEKLRVEIYSRIRINGISIAGTEEKPVIIILAVNIMSILKGILISQRPLMVLREFKSVTLLSELLWNNEL